MSLAAPISISQQAQQIVTVLQGYAQAAGGVADLVPNLKMLWFQADQSSQKPRILLCYNGEQSRGDFSVANRLHRVDRQWIVAVTRGTGWNSNRGDSFYKTVGNADPLSDIIEEVRELLRCMIGISEEFPIDFKRISPMNAVNKALDAYAIEFSTANDIPAILPKPDNSPT